MSFADSCLQVPIQQRDRSKHNIYIKMDKGELESIRKRESCAPAAASESSSSHDHQCLVVEEILVDWRGRACQPNKHGGMTAAAFVLGSYPPYLINSLYISFFS